MLLGNKLKRCVWGCMTSAAVLMTSQSVSAELIFQESFEGPLQTETNIVGGFANGQAQNFWAVLPARGLRGAPFWNQAASGGLDGRRYFAGRIFMATAMRREPLIFSTSTLPAIRTSS